VKRLCQLLMFGLLLVAIPLYAAESVIQSSAQKNGEYLWEVTFTITTAADGSMTATDLTQANISILKGMYLLQVDAFPTPGGTAPDAADVILLDENGIDYLGSEDGGTTAYAGLNLVHATVPKSCIPNMYLTGQDTHINYFWPVRGKLTLDIINQATDSADITIILVFTE